jgi:F-type H+-transporting ATPase subunit a
VLTHNLKVRPESKRQIIAEFIVDKVTSLVKENMGEKFLGFAPFIAAILALSAFSSLLSIFGLYSPTADLNTILGWSLLVFVLITYYKLKGGVFNYLKGFTKPIFILTPFNIISEVATPVSMTFRHFGNVASGSVVMTLIYAALASFSTLVLKWLPGVLSQFPLFQIGIPVVFSAYFDIFGGCLQAFIFAMLTMLYIASAAEDDG